MRLGHRDLRRRDDFGFGRRYWDMHPQTFIALCLAGGVAFAQDQPAGPPQRAPGGPAADARAGRRGPWENDVIVYRTTRDGNVARVATFERAGVPTVARLGDGRLIAAHQHFPADFGPDFDKVAVHFSEDEGQTWTAPKVIQLTGLPEGMRFPFDPTLVPLPDGKVRLYFTSTRGRRIDEAPPAIYSAISEDGIGYTFEPGVRFAVEGRIVIDCAVVLHCGVFHLFVPDNGTRMPERGDRPRDGTGYHATSTDGLNFTRQPDVEIEGRRRWLGNAQSDGKVMTFFGTGEGVWMASSADGVVWNLLPSPVVRGADPGAVETRDGGWIVVATGFSRPGAPRPDRR